MKKMIKTTTVKTLLTFFIALIGSSNLYADKIKNTTEVTSNHKLPPAQLGISPPQMNHTLRFQNGKGAVLNKSIVLYNYNPNPKKVTLTFLDMRDDSKQLKPSEQTLAPWTIINPTTFTIPGKGQQTIRMSIRPPENFPLKTHKAVLVISQLVEKPVEGKDGSVVVSFGSSYAMPIKVTATKTDSAGMQSSSLQ